MRRARSSASDRSRHRLSAKIPILAPSVLGLTNNGPEARAQSPSAAISLFPSISRVGGTGRPAAEASARLANLSWHEMRRSRGAAEPREALEAGESGNRRAAIEAHAVGERPHDRPVALRRQFAQPRRQLVEGDELGRNRLPAGARGRCRRRTAADRSTGRDRRRSRRRSRAGSRTLRAGGGRILRSRKR